MTQRTTTIRSARCAMGLTCLLTGTLSLSSFAQDSLQVTFVGDRELQLREVTKPNSNPQRVDLGMEKPTISYEPVVKSISPKTETEDIQPLAVKMDAPLPRLYAGYAKGGFGLYTSPLLDIHFGETQSRNGAWGVNLMHKSSAGSTGQADSLGLDEGWSHNLATGYYRRFIDKSSLTLDGGVERQAAARGLRERESHRAKELTPLDAQRGLLRAGPFLLPGGADLPPAAQKSSLTCQLWCWQRGWTHKQGREATRRL